MLQTHLLSFRILHLRFFQLPDLHLPLLLLPKSTHQIRQMNDLPTLLQTPSWMILIFLMQPNLPDFLHRLLLNLPLPKNPQPLASQFEIPAPAPLHKQQITLPNHLPLEQIHQLRLPLHTQTALPHRCHQPEQS